MVCECVRVVCVGGLAVGGRGAIHARVCANTVKSSQSADE